MSEKRLESRALSRSTSCCIVEHEESSVVSKTTILSFFQDFPEGGANLLFGINFAKTEMNKIGMGGFSRFPHTP